MRPVVGLGFVRVEAEAHAVGHMVQMIERIEERRQASSAHGNVIKEHVHLCVCLSGHSFPQQHIVIQEE